MNNFGALRFNEFAQLVRPSVAVNRLVLPGTTLEKVTYSVYMNGPLVDMLSDNCKEYQIDGAMLGVLTEKLGLTATASRDNMVVAELVAVRDAFIDVTFKAAIQFGVTLSDEVLEDCKLLDAGLNHPHIDAVLSKQRGVAEKLRPWLAALGVNDSPLLQPGSWSMGPVIAQGAGFTLQETDGGKVLHEDARLGGVPQLGATIGVAYYRGHGQIVPKQKLEKVSPPFIDPISGDLAVKIKKSGGGIDMILFDSVAKFENFVTAQGLDNGLVDEALTVRRLTPEALPELPVRQAVSPIYVDERSGCMAVDFVEDKVTYKALFRNQAEMLASAGRFGVAPEQVAVLARSDPENDGQSIDEEKASLEELRASLAGLGLNAGLEAKANGEYVGKIVAASSLHVAQSLGRGGVVVHDQRNLGKALEVGEAATVKYIPGERAVVVDVLRSQGKGVGL